MATDESQNVKHRRYGRGQNPNSLRALVEHGNHGGRRKAVLTDALVTAGSDAELAGLIVKYARKGEPSAMRLWAQYRQSPESVQRVIDSENTDDAIGYANATERELDNIIEAAEEICNLGGASPEREGAAREGAAVAI